MSAAHFEPLKLADGSVLSARLADSGDVVVRRGEQQVTCTLRDVATGRFIVAANQQRAVLVVRSIGAVHAFEVLELRDGLKRLPRGEQLTGDLVHYALSNDGGLLATLVIAEVATLVVRALDGDGRSTHELRLSPSTPWPAELGLKLTNEGAVTFALPWAAQSIPMSPKPPAVITFDVPHAASRVPKKTRFSASLASRTAIERLGDISLRYEPSMLIGETEKLKRSAVPSLAWTGGFALLLLALAALLLPEGALVAAVLLGLAALTIAFATRLERHEKRQRRFVANFATSSLRLDFTSPIVGKPRTIVVPFDDVKDVRVLEQGDGARVLVVEFIHDGARLQDALVAFVPESQLGELERLERVLHGAFGLGEVPPDSPIHDFAEESSFD